MNHNNLNQNIKYSQGDILRIDLDTVKGHEQGKKRPCLIVSNDYYNQKCNTAIIVPISSAEKYNRTFYLESGLFVRIPENPFIHGTILLQHIRSIDLKIRMLSKPLFKLPEEYMQDIRSRMNNFF